MTQGCAALIVRFMGKLYVNFYFCCDFYQLAARRWCRDEAALPAAGGEGSGCDGARSSWEVVSEPRDELGAAGRRGAGSARCGSFEPH